MANKRPVRDLTDPRTFAEMQNIGICFGGIDKARDGGENLLPFVQSGFTWLQHTVVTATDSIDFGDVPMNTVLTRLIVVDAIAAGTLTLALAAVTGGPSAATLATTQSLTSTGFKTMTTTKNLVTRQLTGTLASATVGATFLIGLEVLPIDMRFR